MERLGHWIGGKLVSGESGRTGPVFNPATGEQTHEVDFASRGGGRPGDRGRPRGVPRRGVRTSLSKRADIMFRIRETCTSTAPTSGASSPSSTARCCPTRWARWPAASRTSSSPRGVPHLLKGGFTEQASTGVDVFSIRQPLGVVAGITPFNFPAMVPMWMFANAIACGNTFILKPSEKDPGASLYIAELLKEAGLPDGVFNVVQGDKVVVDRLLEHPDVEAVSFVGSTPIAKYIYATGTANGKRVQALGGAKNHMVVLPDADIDMAADAAVSAALRLGRRALHGDQRRGRGRRRRRPRSSRRSRTACRSVKIGNGLEPESEMGPLVTRQHRDKVAGYLDSATPSRARRSSKTAASTGCIRESDGFFLGVSLLDHVTTEMDAYRDEIFGPVLEVMRVDTYDEALRARERQPLRQRHRDLHARRRRGARRSSSTCRPAWSA